VLELFASERATVVLQIRISHDVVDVASSTIVYTALASGDSVPAIALLARELPVSMPLEYEVRILISLSRLFQVPRCMNAECHRTMVRGNEKEDMDGQGECRQILAMVASGAVRARSY